MAVSPSNITSAAKDTQGSPSWLPVSANTANPGPETEACAAARRWRQASAS